MIIDRLHDEVVQKGMACVGLDVRPEYLPGFLEKRYERLEDRIFAFNRLVIEAAGGKAACFKLQIACYEALGLEGLSAYGRTLALLREKGIVSIADAKRGDISSTASQYAKAHFTGVFEADFMTVNPYMGEDAIRPYYEYVEKRNKGLFVLIKTSNPSAADFQDRLLEDGRPLYMETAQKVAEWGRRFTGACGYSAIGGVVGIQNAEAFKAVRKAHPGLFYLVPGYGAQGGTGEDLARVLSGDCAVVNSSRGIIAGAEDLQTETAFMDLIAERVEAMGKDLSHE